MGPSSHFHQSWRKIKWGEEEGKNVTAPVSLATRGGGAKNRLLQISTLKWRLCDYCCVISWTILVENAVVCVIEERRQGLPTSPLTSRCRMSCSCCSWASFHMSTCFRRSARTMLRCSIFAQYLKCWTACRYAWSLANQYEACLTPHHKKIA